MPVRRGSCAAWRPTPAVRGTGAGRALVVDGLARGGRARRGPASGATPGSTAAGFYERMGFSVVTEPFDKPGIGPHLGMVRDVTPADGPRSG